MTRSARLDRFRRDGRAILTPEGGRGIGGYRLLVILPKGRAVLNAGSVRAGQFGSQEFLDVPFSVSHPLFRAPCEGKYGLWEFLPDSCPVFN